MVNLIVPGIAGGNTQVSFSFNDQPDLRYARITGLFSIYSNDSLYCFPDNVPIIADALANRITLVLQTNDPDDMPKKGGKPGEKEKGENGRFSGTLDTVQWLPLSSIHINQSFGLTPPSFVRSLIHWKDRYVVWQKSKIIMSPGGLGNTADVAVTLGVLYTFTNSAGEIIFPRN